MSTYHHILVVIDLSADSRLIISRALALAAGSSATLHLLHVVEYVPMEPMGETLLPTVQLETELVGRAKQRLAQLATELNLAAAGQIVAFGNIKTEIRNQAEQLGIDLIVVGNHRRHGLKALLNFTEDEVLHVAPCDVLAVQLPVAVRT